MANNLSFKIASNIPWNFTLQRYGNSCCERDTPRTCRLHSNCLQICRLLNVILYTKLRGLIVFTYFHRHFDFLLHAVTAIVSESHVFYQREMHTIYISRPYNYTQIFSYNRSIVYTFHTNFPFSLLFCIISFFLPYRLSRMSTSFSVGNSLSLSLSLSFIVTYRHAKFHWASAHRLMYNCS